MHSKNEMQELTAIIVDDELHGRENLKKIFELYFSEIKVLGLADSVIKARQLVSKVNPDVVFLDINMPVFDGFDFLEEFDSPNFITVFVTAHEEFGIKALKAGAIDYILKPINIKELKHTVKKLLAKANKELITEPINDSEKLVLPSSNGLNVIVIADIIRLEADSCYTKVISRVEKSLIISRTLKEFEDTLPKDVFFRVHKSHLINLKHIKDYSKISGNYVTMSDGSKVEISRRKTPEFILKIKSILKSV
jgi:two-component system, LytTR family, response regulator